MVLQEKIRYKRDKEEFKARKNLEEHKARKQNKYHKPMHYELDAADEAEFEDEQHYEIK